MSNRFLTGGTASSLTNGTAVLFVNEITCNNLTPSKALKTNGVSTIISSDLLVSDVNGLQSELNAKMLNPMPLTVAPANPPVGEVVYYSSSVDGKLRQKNSAGVDVIVGDADYDQSLNTTNNVRFAQLDIGTVLVPRLNIDATAFEVYSPDQTNLLTIDNLGLSYEDGAITRLSIDAVSSRMSGMDGDCYLEMKNDTLDLVIDDQALFRINTAGLFFSGYNNQVDLSITDAANGFRYQDQSGLRMVMNTTHTILHPPDESKGYLELIDDQTLIRHGLVDRLLINATNTTLKTTDATYFDMGTTSHNMVLNSVQRVQMTNLYTRQFGGGASNTYFQIADSGDGGIYAQMAGNQRLLIDGSNSVLASPNTTSYNIVSNVIAQTVVAGTARASHDATISYIQSPDTTKVLSVANTGVTFNTGANSNLLPTGRGTVGQVLTTNGAGATSWETNSTYILGYGGDITGAVRKYLVPSGTFTTSSETVSNFKTREESPIASTIRRVSWASQSATATTEMRIAVNGGAGTLIALIGASGHINGLSIAVAESDFVEVYWDAVGVRPDQMNFRVFFS